MFHLHLLQEAAEGQQLGGSPVSCRVWIGNEMPQLVKLPSKLIGTDDSAKVGGDEYSIEGPRDEDLPEVGSHP